MPKLIRVVRNQWSPEVHVPREVARITRNVRAVMTKEIFADRTNFITEAEFFIVDDADVESFMRGLAENNPGMDIESYTLEQSARAPAGAVVFKKVTKSGVLPA